MCVFMCLCRFSRMCKKVWQVLTRSGKRHCARLFMYVCMLVCMHTCLKLQSNTHMHTYTHAHTHINISTYLHFQLKEEVWEAAARLDSPRRRGVWNILSQLDAVLPNILRNRSARTVQCAYRLYVCTCICIRIRVCMCLCVCV